MILPDYVTKIIKALESARYEAYVVGGCVRDLLLGLTPDDYDITTSATPDEVKAVFEYTHDTGLKHGTITVISDDTPVEVTTFRIDGEYSDNRRPDSVTFTRSLREDLSRRDFTINAMAGQLTIDNGQLTIIDPFGGQNDLENRIIRAVGDPHKRFNEDGLRILRALRFAVVYRFEIEPRTMAAIDELRGLIHNIAGERIAVELNKSAVGFYGLDKVASLALFFDDYIRARRLMRRLKYDNDTFHKVSTVLKYRHLVIKPCKRAVKRVLNRFGEEMFFRLADWRVESIAREVIDSGECWSLAQLAVKGGDLVELGFKGERIGMVLRHLLQMVICERVVNEKGELLNYVKHGHRN
jgi:tRNA nucleotidyltransferase (CCA-adding enzyme)